MVTKKIHHKTKILYTAFYQKHADFQKFIKRISHTESVSSLHDSLSIENLSNDLISKNISLPTSHVNNSFDLYKSFSNIKIPHLYSLNSLDIVLLFM